MYVFPVLLLHQRYEFRTGSLRNESLLPWCIIRVQSARSFNYAQAFTSVWHIARLDGMHELICVEGDDAVLRIQFCNYFFGGFDQSSRHTEHKLVGVTLSKAVAVTIECVLSLFPLLLASAEIALIDFDLDLDYLPAGVGNDVGSVEFIDGDALTTESVVFQQRQL